MSISNKYKIFNEYPESTRGKVKLYYIPNVDELLFVTYDDNVYHLKPNMGKYLIKEICQKEVIKFACCGSNYMALTSVGLVYIKVDDTYEKCVIYESDCFNEKLTEIFFIDICCNDNNSYLLSKNGKLFQLDSTKYKYCGKKINDIYLKRSLLESAWISFKSLFQNYVDLKHDYKRNKKIDEYLEKMKPIIIKINDKEIKIISISCGCDHIVILSDSGKVFGMGSNRWGQLGVENNKTSQKFDHVIPIALNIDEIKQITCGPFFTLMLNKDGEVYFCGSTQLNRKVTQTCGPKKVKMLTKNGSSIYAKEIASTFYSNLSFALSNDDKCYQFISDSNGNINSITQSEINSIDESYAYYERITLRNIKIEITEYDKSFKEIRALGNGGFSTVYESLHIASNERFAIKKVSFSLNNHIEVLKEIDIIKQLKSELVVKYYDSWIEKNYYIDSNDHNICETLLDIKKPLLLHIQMELCSLTLRDVINIIMKECRTKHKKLTLIGYFTSNELLYEILECLLYIHSQNPALIHRDLKPENILIKHFSNNRFVKLSDFGLSTYHEIDGQSHTKYKGTKNYRATELNYSTKYTTKADMFSLGIIIQELFDIDLNDTNRCCLSTLKDKMAYLVKLISKLLSPLPEIRPDCIQVLSTRELWRITRADVDSDEHVLNVASNHLNNFTIEGNFINYFLKTKT